jgi:hypothetical protein
MITSAPPAEVQVWPIDRLVLYARNPRKNDGAFVSASYLRLTVYLDLILDKCCPSRLWIPAYNPLK